MKYGTLAGHDPVLDQDKLRVTRYWVVEESDLEGFRQVASATPGSTGREDITLGFQDARQFRDFVREVEKYGRKMGFLDARSKSAAPRKRTPTPNPRQLQAMALIADDRGYTDAAGREVDHQGRDVEAIAAPVAVRMVDHDWVVVDDDGQLLFTETGRMVWDANRCFVDVQTGQRPS